jgi:hypothetical protein
MQRWYCNQGNESIYAKQNVAYPFLNKVKVLPDSIFPSCKSWIKNLYEYFLSGIKFEIVFQG